MPPWAWIADGPWATPCDSVAVAHKNLFHCVDDVFGYHRWRTLNAEQQSLI
jgi:hypothetical protein